MQGRALGQDEVNPHGLDVGRGARQLRDQQVLETLGGLQAQERGKEQDPRSVTYRPRLWKNFYIIYFLSALLPLGSSGTLNLEGNSRRLEPAA